MSINYQATRLLGVLISYITIHLSTFRLQQHGNREMNNDGENITVSRVHRMVCNFHDNLDIKMVILQGRTESKAGLAFDLRITTALTQS